MNIIKGRKLSYDYFRVDEDGKEEEAVRAVDQVDLDVKEGDFVAILGHNGSGKSTLAKHINAILLPTEGTLYVDGKDTKDESKLWEIRQSAGMVFQYPEQQLFAETVYEDIAFGPKNMGLPYEEIKERVTDAMRFVGLDFETFAGRSPFSLSGGQMRRVAMAGVVAMNPDYLILDEPSAGLDPGVREAIFEEIMALYKKRKIGIIMVTHSMEEAARFANRLLVVSDGRIILDGKPGEIFLKEKKKLLDVGMDIPEVYKLADALRARGLRLPQEITDAKVLLTEVKKRKGWK